VCVYVCVWCVCGMCGVCVCLCVCVCVCVCMCVWYRLTPSDQMSVATV